MSNKYRPRGDLLALEVTDREDSIASDVAIDLIHSLGGNAETHGDHVQTLVMMGVVAALRSADADNGKCEFCESDAMPAAVTDLFSAVNLCLECMLYAVATHVVNAFQELTNGATDKFVPTALESVTWIKGLNDAGRVIVRQS